MPSAHILRPLQILSSEVTDAKSARPARRVRPRLSRGTFFAAAFALGSAAISLAPTPASAIVTIGDNTTYVLQYPTLQTWGMTDPGQIYIPPTGTYGEPGYNAGQPYVPPTYGYTGAVTWGGTLSELSFTGTTTPSTALLQVDGPATFPGTRNFGFAGDNPLIISGKTGRIVLQTAASVFTVEKHFQAFALDNGANLTVAVASGVTPTAPLLLFTGNASNTGGVFFANNGSTLTVSTGIIFGNLSNPTSDRNYAITSGGGAIYNSGSSTMTLGGAVGTAGNVSFYGNAAINSPGEGGAILNTGSSKLNITSAANFGDAATVGSGNSAYSNGGAISNIGGVNGTPGTINNSYVSMAFGNFYRNEAQTGSGGAISNVNGGRVAATTNYSTSTFGNATIGSGNTALVSGGAIYNSGAGSTVTFSDFYSTTNFYGNTATGTGTGQGLGGAIYNDAGGLVSLYLANFGAAGVENTAQVSGGAIYNTGTNSRVTVTSGFNNFLANEAITGSGGAVYNAAGGTVTIPYLQSAGSNATVTNKAHVSGGFLFNSGATTTLGANFLNPSYVINFLGNTAETGYGGAIYNENQGTAGTVTIYEHTNFGRDNAAPYGNKAGISGGAIYNTAGTINFGTLSANVNFFGSEAQSGSGGAIYNDNGGKITFTASGLVSFGSTIAGTGNTAYLSGGAIYNHGIGTGGTSDSAVSMPSGNFYRNTATTGSGGAIFNDAGGRITISSATFGSTTAGTGNTAALYGGAIYNYGIGVGGTNDSNVTISSGYNSFLSNSAGISGGAIYNANGGLVQMPYLYYFGYYTGAGGNIAQVSGGGIYNTGEKSEVKITGGYGSFSANKAITGSGGAIYNDAGQVNITVDSWTTAYLSFQSNTAGQSGGAIYNANGGRITYSSLYAINFGATSGATGNTAVVSGGAIYNSGTGSSVSFTNYGYSSFYGNKATGTGTNEGLGGAIYNEDHGTISIPYLDLASSNTAALSGGFLFNSAATAILGTSGYSTSFYGNQATAGYGGAIYNEADGQVTINGDAFFGTASQPTYGNTAGISGGAIYNTGSTSSITFTGSTLGFNYNKATTGFGGAIYNDAGTIQAALTTGTTAVEFRGNTATTSGAVIYNTGGGTVSIIAPSAASMPRNFVISSNQVSGADSVGAVIYNSGTGSNVTLTNRRNPVSGGGILYTSNTAITFSGSLISGTGSISKGAYIYNEQGSVALSAISEAGGGLTTIDFPAVILGGTNSAGGVIYNTGTNGQVSLTANNASTIGTGSHILFGTQAVRNQDDVVTTHEALFSVNTESAVLFNDAPGADAGVRVTASTISGPATIALNGVASGTNARGGLIHNEKSTTDIIATTISGVATVSLLGPTEAGGTTGSPVTATASNIRGGVAYNDGGTINITATGSGSILVPSVVEIVLPQEVHLTGSASSGAILYSTAAGGTGTNGGIHLSATNNGGSFLHPEADATIDFGVTSTGSHGGAIFNNANSSVLHDGVSVAASANYGAATVHFDSTAGLGTSTGVGGGVIYNSGTSTVDISATSLAGKGELILEGGVYGTAGTGGILHNSGGGEVSLSSQGGGLSPAFTFLLQKDLNSGLTSQLAAGGAIFNNGGLVKVRAFNPSGLINNDYPDARPHAVVLIGGVANGDPITDSHLFHANEGGAIYNNGATSRVQVEALASNGNAEVVIAGQATSTGGAIYNESGSVRVNAQLVGTLGVGRIQPTEVTAHVTFYSTAGVSGGAIFNTGVTGNVSVTAQMDKFTKDAEHNAAIFFTPSSTDRLLGYGGAIYNDIGTVNVEAISAGFWGYPRSEGLTNYSASVYFGAEGKPLSANYGGAISNIAAGKVTIRSDAQILRSLISFNSNASHDGGAIYNHGIGAALNANQSTVTLVNYNAAGTNHYDEAHIVFDRTSADDRGGAIFNDAGGSVILHNYNGNITYSSIEFDQTKAGTYGGGIYNEGKNLGLASFYTLTADGTDQVNVNLNNTSTVLINVANTVTDLSGALRDFRGNAMTRFAGNEAQRGGAIYNDLSGFVRIDGSFMFTDNNAKDAPIDGSQGGAIYNDRNSVFMTREGDGNFFINNTAEGNGGAIYNDNHSVVDIYAYTESYELLGIPLDSAVGFSGNQAIGGHGGGIYNSHASSVLITTVSFEMSNNSATEVSTVGGLGGAIYNDEGGQFILRTISIENDPGVNLAASRMRKNTAVLGGAIYNKGNGGSTFPVGGTLLDFDGYRQGFESVVTLIENTAERGGGLYNINNAKVIFGQPVTFLRNEATKGFGGGIYNENAWMNGRQINISGSTVTHVEVDAVKVSVQENKAYGLDVLGVGVSIGSTAAQTYGLNGEVGYGGGAFLFSDQPVNVTLTHSVFSDNEAEVGGGVYKNAGIAVLTLDKSYFFSNGVEEIVPVVSHPTGDHYLRYSRGGAVYNDGGNLLLSNTSFYTNTSALDSGAVAGYGNFTVRARWEDDPTGTGLDWFPDSGYSLFSGNISRNASTRVSRSIYFEAPPSGGASNTLNVAVGPDAIVDMRDPMGQAATAHVVIKKTATVPDADGVNTLDGTGTWRLGGTNLLPGAEILITRGTLHLIGEGTATNPGGANGLTETGKIDLTGGTGSHTGDGSFTMGTGTASEAILSVGGIRHEIKADTINIWKNTVFAFDLAYHYKPGKFGPTTGEPMLTLNATNWSVSGSPPIITIGLNSLSSTSGDFQLVKADTIGGTGGSGLSYDDSKILFRGEAITVDHLEPVTNNPVFDMGRGVTITVDTVNDANYLPGYLQIRQDGAVTNYILDWKGGDNDWNISAASWLDNPASSATPSKFLHGDITNFSGIGTANDETQEVTINPGGVQVAGINFSDQPTSGVTDPATFYHRITYLFNGGEIIADWATGTTFNPTGLLFEDLAFGNYVTNDADAANGKMTLGAYAVLRGTASQGTPGPGVNADPTLAHSAAERFTGIVDFTHVSAANFRGGVDLYSGTFKIATTSQVGTNLDKLKFLGFAADAQLNPSRVKIRTDVADIFLANDIPLQISDNADAVLGAIETAVRDGYLPRFYVARTGLENTYFDGGERGDQRIEVAASMAGNIHLEQGTLWLRRNWVGTLAGAASGPAAGGGALSLGDNVFFALTSQAIAPEGSPANTPGTLKGLQTYAFQYNRANWGGAISVGTSTVLAIEAKANFSHNTASTGTGGAIDNPGHGIVTIRYKSEFLDNVASISGGAIYNRGLPGPEDTINHNKADFRLYEEVSFENNTAFSGHGGAIFNQDGTVYQYGKQATFVGNSADFDGARATLKNVAAAAAAASGTDGGRGGAIYNVDGTVFFEDTVNVKEASPVDILFLGNTATFEGGGIYNENGNVTLHGTGHNGEDRLLFERSGVRFDSNVSKFASGGGIYTTGTASGWQEKPSAPGAINTFNFGDGFNRQITAPTSTIAISANYPFYSAMLFASNSADVDGGGIYNNSSKITMTGHDGAGVGFASNTAGQYGGAIFNTAGDIVINAQANWGRSVRFDANSALDKGGAIHNINGGNIAISATGGDGSTIYFDANNVTKANSTGGVIYNVGNAGGGDGYSTVSVHNGYGADSESTTPGYGASILFSGAFTSATGTISKGGIIYNEYGGVALTTNAKYGVDDTKITFAATGTMNADSQGGGIYNKDAAFIAKALNSSTQVSEVLAIPDSLIQFGTPGYVETPRFGDPVDHAAAPLIANQGGAIYNENGTATLDTLATAHGSTSAISFFATSEGNALTSQGGSIFTKDGAVSISARSETPWQVDEHGAFVLDVNNDKIVEDFPNGDFATPSRATVLFGQSDVLNAPGYARQGGAIYAVGTAAGGAVNVLASATVEGSLADIFFTTFAEDGGALYSTGKTNVNLRAENSGDYSVRGTAERPAAPLRPAATIAFDTQATQHGGAIFVTNSGTAATTLSTETSGRGSVSQIVFNTTAAEDGGAAYVTNGGRLLLSATNTDTTPYDPAINEVTTQPIPRSVAQILFTSTATQGGSIFAQSANTFVDITTETAAPGSQSIIAFDSTATTNGGAIYAGDNAIIHVTAKNTGGTYLANTGDAFPSASPAAIIFGNTAPTSAVNGGAIYATGGSAVIVTTETNHASQLANSRAGSIIFNSHVTAGGKGGSIYNSGSTVVIGGVMEANTGTVLSGNNESYVRFNYTYPTGTQAVDGGVIHNSAAGETYVTSNETLTFAPTRTQLEMYPDSYWGQTPTWARWFIEGTKNGELVANPKPNLPANNFAAESKGGVVYNEGTNSTVNLAGSGERRYWLYDFGNVVKSTNSVEFIGNAAGKSGSVTYTTGQGGAIYNANGASVYILDSNASPFKNNSTGDWIGGGGAAFFSANEAHGQVGQSGMGGAIHNENGSLVYIRNRNYAYYVDGPLSGHVDGEQWRLGYTAGTFAFFEGNRADFAGGAIYNIGNNSRIEIGTEDGDWGGGNYVGTLVHFNDNVSNGLSNLNGGGGAIYNSGTGALATFGPSSFGGLFPFELNISFSGNKADSGLGGAIANFDGARVHINANTVGFTQNTAFQGGAISNQDSDIFGGTEAIPGDISGLSANALHNPVFRDNLATGNGGAISNDAVTKAATVKLFAPVFTRNQAAQGGAIYNSAGGTLPALVTLVDSTFTQNSASSSGGAIYNAGVLSTIDLTTTNPGPKHLYNTNLFEGNTAFIDGGAIYNTGTLQNANNAYSEIHFIGNEAGTDGGALYNEGTVNLSHALFNENKAAYGGAIYDNAGNGITATFTNSNFYNSTARRLGGAIYKTGAGTITIAADFSTGRASDGWSEFSGNFDSLEATARSNSVYFDTGTGSKLNIVTASGAVVNMPDPMGGSAAATNVVITKSGTGTWKLGGDSVFAGTGANVSINGGTLHLYRGGEILNGSAVDATGTPLPVTPYVETAQLRLGTGSTFTLAANTQLSVGGGRDDSLAERSGNVISAGTINIGANTTMSFDFANHRGQAVFGDGASYRTAEAAYPMLTLTAPTVNVTGPVQVNLTTLIPQSGVLAAGRYHLVAGGNFTGGKLAGSGGGSITTQIRIAGELASSNSRTAGKLTVEAPSLWGTGGYDLVTQEIERLALVWTGANGSDWNISSQNWKTWDNYGTEDQFTAPQTGIGQQFLPGDVVLLDSANFSVPTTVNILSGGAAPSEVFVRNGNYSEDPTVAASMRADLNAGGTFTLNSAAGGLGLTGDARLTKLGTGTLVLNGTHTYKGETEVRGGYLRVDGDSRQATGNLTVYAGAVLSGRGIIGGAVSIQRGGYLSPSGSTPYNLASNPSKPAWRIGTTFETTTPGVATAPVTLHFANNVVLETGSTLVIRVQGSNATGYSALDKLNFTNATNNNFVAKPGTKIFVDLDITDINQLSNPFFRVSVITGASISDSTTRNVQIYSLNFPGTKYGLDTQGYLYTIPEPSTYGLLGGVSLLGLALFRRHRAKRKAVNRAVSEN